MNEIGKSGYRGVKWHGPSNRYIARIRIHGKRTFLGAYWTKEEAALSYDRAARTYHGAGARLNFPNKEMEVAA
jgi:hypothetical protein